MKPYENSHLLSLETKITSKMRSLAKEISEEKTISKTPKELYENLMLLSWNFKEDWLADSFLKAHNLQRDDLNTAIDKIMIETFLEYAKIEGLDSE